LWYLGVTIAGQIDQKAVVTECKKVDQLGAARLFADISQPVVIGMVLSALDFPALDRPAKATSIPVAGGRSRRLCAEMKKLAFWNRGMGN
jgi:hypothetical protein